MDTRCVSCTLTLLTAGLINLARNVGGSVGISLVTTLLARRTQFHQARLVENTTFLNPAFSNAVRSAQQALGRGADPNTAYAMLARRLQQQAETLSYIDCFFLLAVVFLMLIPLVFLMKKTVPGQGRMGH